MSDAKVNVGISTKDQVDFVLSAEGQIVAARGLELIKKAIADLPELPIIGLVFGLTMATDEKRLESGAAFSTDTMGMSWGLKPCIDAAIDEALHGNVDENAVQG